MFTLQAFVVALCATGILSAPQRPQSGSEKDAVITSQQLEVSHDGTYVNNFETSNGISHQESGQTKQVDQENPVIAQGSSSYTSPEGERVSIQFIADENGYQVQGSHVPTPPPIPPEIQKALAWIAAHPEENELGNGNPPPRRG